LAPREGVGQTDVDHLGDALDAILQDPLDPGLERDRRGGTRDARADELDLDHAGGLVDAVEDDVAVVSLDGRANHFDDLFDLLAHAELRLP
jgi:hypothetical protein